MRVPWMLRFGLMGATLVAFGFVVYWSVRAPEVERVAVDRLDRDLAASAHALAAGLSRDDLADPGLDARVKAMGRGAGLRFTVVGEDGRVLADSEIPDVGTMLNHGSREEVRAALDHGVAVSRRVSDSVSRELRYGAVRVHDTRAVARAALDGAEAEALVREETRFPWVPFAISVLVAAALAALVLGPTAAGVTAVARALADLERGALAARAPVRGPDFLRGLSTAFNGMAARLESDLARVTAERARLATVLDGMDEGVFAIDGEQGVRFVNRAGRLLLGLAPDEPVEGRALPYLLRNPQLLAVVRAALAGREAEDSDVLWDAAPWRLLHARAAPVQGGGPGAVLLVGDVSRLRRLERMRSDFVANVSHELRTPLAAISGAAETLADGALSDAEAAPRFVDTIARHAARLRAIVDDLLTLSRLESAPETIERVPVDFSAVVRQACEALAPRARDAGLAWEVRADAALPVRGDPEALRRLVDNLVVNALTYTPAGGWVRVVASRDAGRAVLTVADSGIGISAEHLDRIFERFYRVDKARSRAKGGTGLGLAIVKHAASLHGGAVEVQSRPDQGSTFTVGIPLAADVA